jgi:hypothetical protein
MSKEFTELCKRLEAERHDVTWKNPKPREFDAVTVTQRIYPKKSEQDKRDKLMFNAGRFAAGARDKTAVKANAWLEAQE